MAKTEPSVMLHGDLESMLVDASAVQHHPMNPRHGDVDAIRASVRENGLYRPIVVQRSTGYIIAGNHLFDALTTTGDDTDPPPADRVPVLYVDADDEQARRILVADNRTSDLGDYDSGVLADLLTELAATDTGLTGTGYAVEDLDALLSDLDSDTSGFVPSGSDVPSLDQLEPRPCQKCGYDTANNPEQLT